MSKETGEEINEVPEDRKSRDSPSTRPQVESPCKQIYQFQISNKRKASKPEPKITGPKYVEYSSDEFADIEDNARDSLSDNNEPCSDLKSVPAMRFSTEPFPSSRSKQGQKNETGEENRTLIKYQQLSSSTSDIDTSKHIEEGPLEVGKVSNPKILGTEASCSYSHSNSFKPPKTFCIPLPSEEIDKKIKHNLSTIVEESESENKMNYLKNNQPTRSKVNPLKMKSKVGIRRDKCNVCRVRLGLCAIKCRCGGYYCAKHRYDKEHNCPFDYKTMGAEEIRRNNPKVIAEKVRKL